MKVKANYVDVSYDRTTQDLAVSAGDLAPYKTSHADQLTQLLEDAFESQFNSMKYVMQWGFEGRNDDYTVIDNEVRQRAYMYLAEMLVPMGFLILNVKALSPTWTATGVEFAIEIVLADLQQNQYNKTLSWNQTSKRCAVT